MLSISDSLHDSAGSCTLHFHRLFIEWTLRLLLFGGKDVLELSANLFLVEAWSVYPWVALEFLNGVSVLAIVAEQLEDHVFEVSGETSTIYLLEVGFNLTGQEEVVEIFLLSGFFKGKDALYDNKDDYTYAE